MAKTIVGIDFSSNGLRAVELGDATRAKPTLLRHHEIALPPGAISKGEVLEPRTVATALKQLWNQAGFKSKDVVLGIGNSRVLARDLTVPKMSIERIRESLPFQVQEMLPFPTEDALLDFYPISESEGESGKLINGLLVAAVKDVVLNNVKAVQLAGLNPVEVDLIPFALSRLLLRGTASTGTIAVIDVGGSTTTVLVSANGVPQFVRIIPTGGDDLTNALVGRLGVTPEQAESLKRTVGLAPVAENAEQHTAIALMYEVTSELITSLRNTLTYFANARGTSTVTGIILTGGGAKLSGFSAALGEFTRLPVAVSSPLDTLDVSQRLDRPALEHKSDVYAVAIGLALGSAA